MKFITYDHKDRDQESVIVPFNGDQFRFERLVARPCPDQLADGLLKEHGKFRLATAVEEKMAKTPPKPIVPPAAAAADGQADQAKS